MLLALSKHIEKFKSVLKIDFALVSSLSYPGNPILGLGYTSFLQHDIILITTPTLRYKKSHFKIKRAFEIYFTRVMGFFNPRTTF